VIVLNFELLNFKASLLKAFNEFGLPYESESRSEIYKPIQT